MSKSFSINAGTFTIKYNYNKHCSENILLNNSKRFLVPIYQRPYSWNEIQVRKFIEDIFISFRSCEQEKTDAEPMFIGTMQLSEIKKNNYQHIIDGQQRITTFLILLKVLKTQFPHSKELQETSLNWLKTEVNNGEQQYYLQEMLNLSDFNSIEETTLSKYLINAKLIHDVLKQKFENQKNNIDEFVKHLFSNIYFVVIETKASLSKTLQIFDAINTTGLDLNAGDLFKIRMYEYLNKNGDNNQVFNEISDLYKKIDYKNKILKSKVADIQKILSIYQIYLIAKYNLPSILYTYGTSTFFDRLFDTLFNINNWEHFNNALKSGDFKIKLNEIDAFIDIRYEWEENWRNNSILNVESAGLYNLWKWSRYSRYRNYIFLLLYQLRDDNEKYEKLANFTKSLTKLYLIYSILYQKAINEIKGSFNQQLAKLIVNNSYDEVMCFIDEKMQEIIKYKRDALYRVISGDILYSAKVKNILCRLSALLEEDFNSNNPEDVKRIKENLFGKNIDIEHIQSVNHEDLSRREKIKELWGENLNSLGNLVILEQQINRKIKNKEEKKLTGYKGSKFKIVNTILVEQYKNWSLQKCVERKEYEVEKIINYLMN